MNQSTPTYAKWGDAVSTGPEGFQIVPNVLLRNQDALRLSSTEMIVLLNILMHWWTPDDLPFPRTNAIAKRMGSSVRTVERSIQRLAELSLVERLATTANDGPGQRRFDPAGLVERLQLMATEGKEQAA